MAEAQLEFDYGYVYCKRGDKYKVGQSLDKTSHKHGACVQYLDLNDDFTEPSEHERAVYLVLKVPMIWKDGFNALIDNYSANDPDSAFSFYVDYNELEALTDNYGLASAVKTKASIPILDCMELPKTIFKIASTYNFDREKIIDVMAVSTGSYTVGSGGDYSTLALALTEDLK